MADEKPKRRRSMKPKPGVLDLEATEIESAPPERPAPSAEADLAADLPFSDEVPEADPEAEPARGTESSAAPHEPRTASTAREKTPPRVPVASLVAAALGGAALALAAFFVLVSSGLLPLAPDDGALAARVAGLEAELRKAQQSPPPAPDDNALRAEISSLKSEIAMLRDQASALPPPDTAVQTRLAEIGSQLDQLSRSAADHPAMDAVERLSARLDELSAEVSARPAPDVEEAVADARSAAALAAVAALESAVARGVPYADALASVRNRIPAAPVAALEAQAERGLPPAALLADRLKASLDRAPAPRSTATNLVDRLKEGAFSLVRVRPVDGSVPDISADDPWSIRSAVSARLDQQDYAAALADWEKLDPAAREATKTEADALKARLAADAALDDLRAAALSQTGTAH